MEIRVFQGVKEAAEAKGIAVVIDVFRAFSLECYLLDAGAEKVLPVGAVETAYRLKEERPGCVLAGERGGRILPGFDLGNSPSQIDAGLVRGRTVVHTTSAGTQGIVAAYKGADEILLGSLVNAGAIASYILSRRPETVSLVCMGAAGITETPEDDLCAAYIASILTDSPIDMAAGLMAVRDHKEGRKFFDPAQQDVFPQADFALCTAVDRFDTVLRAVRLTEDVFEAVRV